MAGTLPPWNPKALRPLSQVSLRVNKRSHWSFLTPLKPIVTSPTAAATNTGIDIILKAWIISTPQTILWVPNMRPYMNPTCHNHCTDISPVRDNRMTLQGSFCVNFVGAIIALVSPLWETIIWLFREAFLWILDAQPPHSKLYLILTWSLKKLGWT